MLFSKPLIFLACDQCGGAAGASSSSVNTTKSSKYPALGTGTALKLLGVADAGEQQLFLTGTVLPGFVWITEDGLAVVNVAPALTLPDATSGVPTRLMVGTPANPSQWQQLVAPPTGNWVLVVEGGTYKLVGTGAIPLDMLGELGGTASPLILAGIREISPGVWSTDKLTVSPQRVLVGHGDGVSVKSLPVDEYLVHPLGQFSALRLATFTQLDAGGLEIAGGIAPGVNDGTNNVLCIFNISSKKFFRAPARVSVNVTATTSGGDVHVGEGVSWVALDPHCKTTQTFNYPDAYLDAYIRAQITNVGVADDDYTMDFAVFVDGGNIAGTLGTPEKIFNIEGSKDNNISLILKGLSLGSHTIEIKARKAVVVDQTMRIVVSDMSVFSLV